MFVEAIVFWAAWCVLLLFGEAASVSERPWPCPQKCDCRNEKLQVNCSWKHLTGVPEGLSVDTQSLNLSHNRLRTLGRRQFNELAQLWELDLSYNVISMIEVDAFQGLQSLRTLFLKNNRLKIIPVGVFSGLHSLQILDISDNEILVFLDYTFRELVSLHLLEAGVNDLVFISHRAFTDLQNLQELNVDRCNLTSIPTEALSQLQCLTRLRLRRLSISILPNNSFRRMLRLHTLEITHWPSLDTVAGNSLMGLNVTFLTISHCNLTAVPYTALRHLAYLRYLDLSYNPITALHGNLLSDLQRLQEFHLAGGNLLKIELGAFRGLGFFHLLNVSSNQLSTLEEGVFHSVGNLQTLRLDGNPLACDCRLLWVVRRRLRLDFDGHSPSCSTPEMVRNREFRDFSEAELPGLFTCRQARIVDRRPQELKVEEGTTVVFDCSADGDPSPSISWMSNQQKALSSTGRVRVLNNGTLEVRYAQVQDSGTFLCMASNAAGNDNISVSLHVLQLPSTHNRTASHFSQESLTLVPAPSAPNTTAQVASSFPFDAKTLVIAMTMGFLSFLSSVAICFVFMFFWSQSQGQIKHNANIDFVPRTSMGGGGGDGVDTGKFTMKLI
ncbi:leucine-rich repeat and immunoglobulin-like domain-containing nogo receptor-interacting protein 4b [Scleropages formosus]|uniref:Leucine rich repeat and Ig domain containing 4b n=1 Tax=Scleropages formosus TaxID=113540 RepID=A0A8C9RNJ8_SCLFO|nr:leucine-rich repeat and immunoglobulin-like domain-containing nogo receptor-interacting protein 1 [Scleropages formosus]